LVGGLFEVVALAELLELKVFFDIRLELSEFLGLTVRPILGMSALKFTCVCLPTEILTIDKRDGLVSLLGWNMLNMCIKPVCWLSCV